MRKLTVLTAALTLVAATLYGCDGAATTEPEGIAGEALYSQGGSWVFNRGAGMRGPSSAWCWYGSFQTHDMTVIHTPSGRVLAKCHFEDLPALAKAQTASGFGCVWLIPPGEFPHWTNDTHWTRSAGGKGTLTCRLTTDYPPPEKQRD